MDTAKRTVMVGIHGWWGSGKTWLAHSTPGPRLTFEMEGGSEDIQQHKLYWEPVSNVLVDDADSVVDWDAVTDDTSVIVDISDYNVVAHLLTILEAGRHPFNSVVFDSLTENQKQLKEMVATPGESYDPNAVFDQQAWGRLLNNGELIIRRLRNLTRKSATKRINVVIVMGSDTESTPVKPLLQGALRKSLAGFLDLEGYLYTALDLESKEEARLLQITPSATAEAKCRLHNVKVEYGTHIVNPDMRDILAVVNGE